MRIPPTRLTGVAWATTVAGILLILTWSFLRTREPGAQETIVVVALAATGLLAAALSIREYLANHKLSRDTQLAHEGLRLALEAGNAVGWDWDVRSGRDVWFGDLKTMFGIAAKSYAGRVEEFRNRVHPDDRELVWRAVAEARQGRTMYQAKFRVRWADGTVRWVAATGKFSYAPNGEPLRMLGIAEDITERQHFEDELRESEERLNGIVQLAMDAIIAIDNERRITVFNAAAEKMLGCSADAAIGTSLDRFVPDRFHAACRRHLRQVAETNENRLSIGAPRQFLARRAAGEEFPVEASISHSGVGDTSTYTLIVRDVSERIRAEEARRESEKRFQLVADSAPVMLWQSGPDKLCNYFNRPWLEFTGRPLEDQLGNGWTESVHPDDLRQCMETYTQAFDRRDRFRMEYRLRRHDGAYRWVLGTGVPRIGQCGSFAGYIGSAIDVTEQRIAKESLSGLTRKLMEAQETERTWIARELHEDVAQRMALLNIELERLGQIFRSRQRAQMGGRVKELCGRAIELERDIQSISHRLRSSKLELMGITTAAAGFCKELCSEQQMQIDFSHDGIPDNLPKEVALCLFRVLEEAVNNAVKHAGVSHVKVALRGSRDEIHLEVIDKGIGFDLEAAIGNHGFGLVSMHERLSQVNGGIDIESQRGVGTTIRARVPLLNGAVTADRGPSEFAAVDEGARSASESHDRFGC